MACTDVVFCQESWETFWPEARLLAEAHFALDNPPGTPRHGKFDLDTRLLAELNCCGYFLIFTGRLAGKLVGYCCWNLTNDVECKGLLLATQGPVFGDDLAIDGLALYRFALDELRRRGVTLVYCYHRLTPRGLLLGHWFRRIGARPLKHEYELVLEPL